MLLDTLMPNYSVATKSLSKKNCVFFRFYSFRVVLCLRTEDDKQSSEKPKRK